MWKFFIKVLISILKSFVKVFCVHLREIEEVSNDACREALDFVVVVSEHCGQILFGVVDVLFCAGFFIFEKFLLQIS